MNAGVVFDVTPTKVGAQSLGDVLVPGFRRDDVNIRPMRISYNLQMNLPKEPVKKRPPRKNLVAIDGTLDRVDRLRVSIREKGEDANPFELRIAHRDAVREHVDCSNPSCYNGGICLGNLLREMVHGRQEEFIGTSFCTGQEGNPEEPGPHPSCATRFEIEATLRYR